MHMETSPNASRRLLRRGILAGAVLVLIAVLFWWSARPKPIAVIVGTTEAGKVETTVANTRAGSVTACRRAKLAPPMGGRIDKLLVREGDLVARGEPIARLGNTGRSSAPHLHFEVRLEDEPLDPAFLIPSTG